MHLIVKILKNDMVQYERHHESNMDEKKIMYIVAVQYDKYV